MIASCPARSFIGSKIRFSSGTISAPHFTSIKKRCLPFGIVASACSSVGIFSLAHSWPFQDPASSAVSSACFAVATSIFTPVVRFVSLS